MLKLYGFAVSNYFNMVKHSLLHKGVDFEEITVYPNAGADYLSKSPMGKVPCIETENGCLAETSVILDYLEVRYPDQPLYPADPWQRAKCLELMKVAELYLELPARRLLPVALAGAAADEKTVAEVKEVMDKGIAAVTTLVSFKPYVLGDSLTLADIVLRYAMVVADLVGGAVFQRDIAGEVAGMAEWKAMMASSPISQQLDTDTNEAMAAFLAMLKGK